MSVHQEWRRLESGEGWRVERVGEWRGLKSVELAGVMSPYGGTYADV